MELLKDKLQSQSKREKDKKSQSRRRYKIEFRDIRDRNRRIEVAKEITAGTKEALKAGQTIWNWQNQVLDEGKAKQKKEIGIMKRTFERIHDKLEHKLAELKTMIVNTDEQSHNMNGEFNYKMNRMTDQFYDELELLAKGNQKRTDKQMKFFKAK